MKRAVVFGGAGFIGSHLVERLKAEGYWVRAVDRDFPAVWPSAADDFLAFDLRVRSLVEHALRDDIDELYQLAAEMGGAGYICTGDNDARIVHDSALINLHAAHAAQESGTRVFFSSSACVYPRRNQTDPLSPTCDEDSVYPADPDSNYGWEKLFAERTYLAYAKNHGLDVRIGRLHNVYGPGNAYQGGREKAPAALCRKVATAVDGGELEIWGDGEQTRSFLFVDDCVAGIRALMQSPLLPFPVNIGSEEMISIAGLARLVMRVAGRTLTLKPVEGPEGVRGRTSDNHLMRWGTGWEPRVSLEEGIEKTYRWVADCIARREE